MTRRRSNPRPAAAPLSRQQQEMLLPMVRRRAASGSTDRGIAEYFAEYGPFAVTQSQVRHLRERFAVESAFRSHRRSRPPARVPISDDVVAAARAAAAADDEPPAALTGAHTGGHNNGSNWVRGPDETEPFCRVCRMWIDADRTGRATAHKRLVWLLARGTRKLASIDCNGYGTPVDWRWPDEPAGRTRQAVAA